MCKYYKALKRYPEWKPLQEQKLWSTFSPTPIAYTPGEVVFPPAGTGLFVFDLKERAVCYKARGWGENYEVWECEVTNPRPGWFADKVDELSTVLQFFTNPTYFSEFFRSDVSEDSELANIVKASYVVDSVKLLTKVE